MNGLDIPKLKKHTVEDHLLKAMGLRLGEGKVEKLLREAEYDPKRAWGKLSRKERNEIIEGLFEMEEERLKDIFPQHFEAFGLLDTSQNFLREEIECRKVCPPSKGRRSL